VAGGEPKPRSPGSPDRRIPKLDCKQLREDENQPVRTEAELLARANLNFVGSYRKLVEHSTKGEVREVGRVTAFATGVPTSLFNGCLVLEAATEPEVDEAVEWVSSLGFPYRVWMEEGLATSLGDTVLGRGLERDPWVEPGMVIHPPPESPPPQTGVTIVEGLDEHLGVLIEGGMPAQIADGLFPPSLAADPDVLLFTARLHGHPVGTSVALRTGDVAGVYAVSTLPEARRRGVGTAATWAAVAAGRAWGCDTVVLQSTEMAFALYATMGFRTVVRYVTFVHPAED
jgi:N-acetylglutamate synthase